MLKQFASFVLASLPGTVKRETTVSLEAAALLGIRRVLARQGRAGEKEAFLSALRESSLLIQEVRASDVLACRQSCSAAC